ncbi:G-protein coupled receptor 161-like [Tachypleus tridentatus]|uniref:G-protein coupled receptor 161-like n=1 Tax=Tachypleus tridentatus TaxID=6853 RepID=UPI003FD4B34A
MKPAASSPLMSTGTVPQSLNLTSKLDSNLNIDTHNGIFRDTGKDLQTIVLIITFIFSVTSNGIVFLVFYKKPLLRSSSNRFVLNLSLTHLLQTLLILPGFLLCGVLGVWTLGDTWCHISGIVSTCLNLETSFSLVLIAVDRNYAVNSPLHYSMAITKRKTGVFITLTWVAASLLSTPLIFGTPQIQFRIEWCACGPLWGQRHLYTYVYSGLIVTAGLVMPLVKLGWTYCSMFLAARTSSVRVRKHSVNTPTLTEVQFFQAEGAIHQVKSSYRRTSSSSQFVLFGDEWKAVRTGVIIILSFFICWGPYYAVIGIEPYIQFKKWPPQYVVPMSIFLSFSSCVVNPYIYVFRNKTTRSHVKQLFQHVRREMEPRLTTFKQADSTSIPHLSPVQMEDDLSSRPQEETRFSLTHSVYERENTNIDQKLYNPLSQLYGQKSYNSPESSVCPQTPFFSCFQEPRRVEFYQYVPVSSLPDSFVVFQLRCFAQDSTSSDTTDNVGTSMDSMDDNFSLYWSMFRKRKNSRDCEKEAKIQIKPRARPPLLRVQSFEQDEQTATVPVQFIPKSFSGRRKSLPQESSDSTLTSSLSTDSQEPQNLARPLLVRQQSISVLYCQKPTEREQ